MFHLTWLPGYYCDNFAGLPYFFYGSGERAQGAAMAGMGSNRHRRGDVCVLDCSRGYIEIRLQRSLRCLCEPLAGIQPRVPVSSDTL